MSVLAHNRQSLHGSSRRPPTMLRITGHVGTALPHAFQLIGTVSIDTRLAATLGWGGSPFRQGDGSPTRGQWTSDRTTLEEESHGIWGGEPRGLDNDELLEIVHLDASGSRGVGMNW